MSFEGKSMDVEVVQGDPPVIRVLGEVDLSNVDELTSALNAAALDSPCGIIIDMSDVTYIDSAGVQAVITVYQQVHRNGGLLCLVLANHDVRGIFDLIHPELLPGFIVADSIDAAMQAFDGSLPPK